MPSSLSFLSERSALSIGVAAATTVAATVYLFGPRARAILLRFLDDGLEELAWQRLPRKIILLRHGQAEHNLEGGAILQEENPDRKPDNLSELTDEGRAQARHAGTRLQTMLGDGAKISVVCSPFERTLQTLYALQQTLGGVQLSHVHIDPRVREQEFGNFQRADEMDLHREQSQEVGRFYYRRPTGESGADVYDRSCLFWDSMLSGVFNPQASFARKGILSADAPDDALLVVTHGLTMRLLLMRYLSLSPQTFDAVYNPGNCDYWVLARDDARRRYTLAPECCSPPRMPWATRQPRTSHPAAALMQLIPGHGHRLDPSRLPSAADRCAFIDAAMAKVVPVPKEDVLEIDWWCGKISSNGVELRRASERGAGRVGRGSARFEPPYSGP